MAATPSRGALGTLIRRRREELGLTQHELAAQLKLDATPAISRWEKGVSPVPPIHWKLLASALELSLKTLLAVAPPKDVKRFHLMELRASKGVPTRRATQTDLDPTLLRQPSILEGFQRLNETYPDFSLNRLVDNACRYFLAHAEEGGLDGRGMPMKLPPGEVPRHPKGGRSDQQSGRPSPTQQRIAKSA
jgi:transcriptional regulator with XRE-family HTH domain